MGGVLKKAIFPKPKESSYVPEEFLGIDRLIWIDSYKHNDCI